jgi:hypothetical protein
VVAVVGMLGQVPAMASGAPDGAVELSADGTTWSKDLAADLFDPNLVWVPGDVGTATLYVRSLACQTGAGRADITLGPQSAVLVTDLAVRSRVDEGAWTGSSAPSFTVTAGQVTRIDVEVTYQPGSGNASQARTVPMTVVVTVSCDAAVLPDGRSGGSGARSTRSVLASTGSATAGVVLAGLALVLAGAALRATRTRVGR